MEDIASLDKEVREAANTLGRSRITACSWKARTRSWTSSGTRPRRLSSAPATAGPPLDRINFDNFQLQNVYEIADAAEIHPVVQVLSRLDRDLMRESLAAAGRQRLA